MNNQQTTPASVDGQMQDYPHNGSFETDLCTMLGLDPSHTEKIVLVVQGGEATKVHVTQLIRNSKMGMIKSELRKYVLTPAKPKGQS